MNTQPRNSLGLFASPNDEPLSKKVVGVRLPVTLYDKVLAVTGNRISEWMRDAAEEKIEREEKGHQKPQDVPQKSELSHPLVQEAIATLIQQKQAALSSELKLKNKGEQLHIKQWLNEIEQLQAMLN